MKPALTTPTDLSQNCDMLATVSIGNQRLTRFLRDTHAV
jgi:hypothetical protein